MIDITTAVSKLQFFRRIICTMIFFLQKNQVFRKNSTQQKMLNKYKELNKYNYVLVLQRLHISLKIVSKDAECYYKMHPTNAVIMLFIGQKNSSEYFSLIVLDLYTISIL